RDGQRREQTMKKMIRLTLVAGAAAALASALAIGVRAEPTNHANRLDVTFTETAASITNRVADLGVFQLILTASGTLDGFGPVTVQERERAVPVRPAAALGD